MDAKKCAFLKEELVPALKKIPSNTPPLWGKMSFHQMVEHLTESVRWASGKIIFYEIKTPYEKLEKMKSFIMTDQPMRENTKNPLLPDWPVPVVSHNIDEALDCLQNELGYFFDVFEKNNQLITRNPLFGDLDYEHNIHLLFKHMQHHLKQFGVLVNQDASFEKRYTIE